MEKQSEQQEIKDIITSREDGFGHRLKIARNERNLSTADVARQLRLDEKIIVALENEDHQQLPVSAFVCGYIRNYAKFLHVQPEPLVDYYKQEISEDSLDPELKITKGIRVGASADVSKVIAPIFLVLVVAALALGGWKLWGYISSSYIALDNSTQSPISSESVSDTGAIQNDAPDSLSLPDLDESYYEPPEEEVSELNTKQDKSGTGIITSETAASAENPVVESVSSNSDRSLTIESATRLVEETIVSEVASETPVNDSAMAEANNRLILEFNGNSWIIIKDANNKTLATGLKKAGQKLLLEGQTPYNVFLGDGRVVKVSIHGKIYDHSHYINDKNIARFNVE